MTAPSSSSIWSRKLDLLYLVFFVTHVPVVLFVDIVPFSPPHLTPTFVLRIRDFYIETFHDKFFEDPPAWFRAYNLMEVVYHTPLSVWAIRGLLRDDPLVPLHLLIFAIQTFLTTFTCLLDMWSWSDRSHEEKVNLSWLYFPYLAFGALLGVDMFLRLRKQLLLKKSKAE